MWFSRFADYDLGGAIAFYSNKSETGKDYQLLILILEIEA